MPVAIQGPIAHACAHSRPILAAHGAPPAALRLCPGRFEGGDLLPASFSTMTNLMLLDIVIGPGAGESPSARAHVCKCLPPPCLTPVPAAGCWLLLPAAPALQHVILPSLQYIFVYESAITGQVRSHSRSALPAKLARLWLLTGAWRRQSGTT